MGERRDNADPADRRGMSATPSVDILLAAVRGGAAADSEGEARAVAAFREAREKGPRTARTRRRDDWRPNSRRHLRFSVRTTLAVLLASLTLGGVAFAAIGSAARDDNGTDGDHGGGRDRHPRTADGAPALPGPSNAPRTNPSASDRPASARETEADCRAPEKSTESGGEASGLRCPSAAGGQRDEERTSQTDKAGRPDGEGSGGGQGRPSEPSASNKPSEPSASNKPGEPSAPSESRASNEPSPPSASGGRPGRAGKARETK